MSRQEFAEPLTVEDLCSWHRQFLGERMLNAGRWRTEPIWIVSGVAGKEKVHFEGPPASRVAGEMEAFVEWFNASGSLPGPVRSGVAHLYFESIHPFADGNGRMGRAIAEIALSQELGYPAVLSLSTAIERQRKEYYRMLNQARRRAQHALCPALAGRVHLRWSTILIVIVCVAALVFLVKVFGYLIEQRNRESSESFA